MLKIVRQKKKGQPEYSAKFAAYIEFAVFLESFMDIDDVCK